jgi:hypothetical protein
VIVHHGHGDSFQSGNPDYRLNETLARFLGSGYAVLAMYTPNYGPAPTADVSKTELANDDRHNPIFAQHGHSPATLRVFLQPMAACLKLASFEQMQLEYGNEMTRYGIALGERWAKAR